MILFSSVIYSGLTNLEYTSRNNTLIETFEDIRLKNVSICMNNDKYDFLYNYYNLLEDDKVTKTLQAQRIIDCNSDTFFVSEQLFNTVLIDRQISINVILKLSKNFTITKDLKIIDLKLPLSAQFFYLKPMSMYKEKFTKLARKTFEAGLNKKWLSDYNLKNRKFTKEINYSKETENQGEITIIIMLVILLVGSISGILALVGEFILNSYWNRKKKLFRKRQNRKKRIIFRKPEIFPRIRALLKK